MTTRHLCIHGNLIEECGQCESDFQQEVALHYSVHDSIPDDSDFTGPEGSVEECK